MINGSDCRSRLARTSNEGQRDCRQHIEALRGVYTPEQIEALTAAYEGALATFQIANRIDPSAHEIARKLFELVDRDRECTPAILYTRALAELDLHQARYYPPAN